MGCVVSGKIPWPDGMIVPAQMPAPFGFSDADWGGVALPPGSYLWKRGGDVLTSMVIARSPGAGAFSRLVRNIEANGCRVLVPTPMGKMPAILKRWGFVRTIGHDEKMGAVDVWKRP